MCWPDGVGSPSCHLEAAVTHWTFIFGPEDSSRCAEITVLNMGPIIYQEGSQGHNASPEVLVP